MDYTKGEWGVANIPSLGWTVSSEERYPIVRLHGYPEAEANANLIAAAPDMYELLRETGRYLSVNYDEKGKQFYYIDQEWFDKRAELLAKAEGK